MFDRVCKHSSAEQLTCRWPQSHTPRRETITRRHTQIDRNLSHKHRQDTLRCWGMRRVSLVTVLWNKTGPKTTVAFLPTPTPHTHHPHSPHLPPSSVVPTALSLLPFITGPAFPPCLCLSHRPETYYWTSFSLNLPSLSDLARFRLEFSFSPSSHPEIRERGREEKKKRENERKCLRHANLYLAKHLHGSMTPWNGPSCSTALQKGAGEGAEQGRVGRRGRKREL